MSLNTVSISGNMCRDPELRETVNGSHILNFTVAVNDRRKGNDGEWEDYASFIDCKMFGKRAQAVAKYLSKGTKVCCEGKIVQDRWTDRDSGNNRSKVFVIVNEIEFMSRSEQKGKQESYESDDIPF